MSNTREKLEVIAHLGDHITYKENIGICYDSDLAKVIEDAYMELKNGITVQEWVSVTEKLPTIYDADDDNCVLAIHKATNKRYYHWRSVSDNPFDFTYWTRTPQPPKGE